MPALGVGPVHTSGCGCGSWRQGRKGFLACCGLRCGPWGEPGGPALAPGPGAPDTRRSIDWLAWERTIGSGKGGSGPVSAAANEAEAELEGVRRCKWWMCELLSDREG